MINLTRAFFLMALLGLSVGLAGCPCDPNESDECSDELPDDDDSAPGGDDDDSAVVDNPFVEGDTPGECSDEVDNDSNGFVDCADQNCAADEACLGGDDDDSAGDDDDSTDTGDDDDATGPQDEICDDGIDNEGDGFVDCDDQDCFSDPVCQGDDDDATDPTPSTYWLAGADVTTATPNALPWGTVWAGWDHDDTVNGWGNSLGISLWTNGSSIAEAECMAVVNWYSLAITDTGDGVDIYWQDDLGNTYNTFTIVNFPASWANYPTGNCAFQAQP